MHKIFQDFYRECSCTKVGFPGGTALVYRLIFTDISQIILLDSQNESEIIQY